MWDRVRAWSKQTGRDPNDLKRQEQHEALEQKSGPTWAAADAFLEYTRTCERTKQGIVLGAATRALSGVGPIGCQRVSGDLECRQGPV